MPKYVVRPLPRTVAQSGHRRDSIITGTHKTLGARGTIESDVQEVDKELETIEFLDKGLPNRLPRRLYHFNGEEITPGPVVKWVDYFQYSARIREQVPKVMPSVWLPS